jgi:transcriptional regulator with XRE-family HTH domain
VDKLNAFDNNSPTEICLIIGLRLKTERLRKNLTQSEVALLSNTSLRTYKRFENTGQGSIETLVGILKTLGRLNILATVLPQSEIPPLQTVVDKLDQLRGKPATHKRLRKRARKVKKHGD